MNNKTFWMRPVDTDLGKWQQQVKEISGSPSFCVLPWIHLATRPNGDMRICCVANASGADDGDYSVGLVKMENDKPANFKHHLPSEAFNNDYMKSVRNLMLDGQVPKSCIKCFKEEEQGVVSKRIWETGSWYKNHGDIKELIESTDSEGNVPFKLKYLDLRLGHTCNLKCIMCSPHDSSAWVSDHKKLFSTLESPVIKKQMSWTIENFDNLWHENPKFWNEIFEQIPNISEIYFAGGEPLMIKHHKYFLQEIIKQGYARQINLRYNSNGILLDEEIIDIWTKFKKVKFGLSMDAIGDRLTYIRYPTDFDIIEKNLWRLENTPDNIEVTIACAVQILNIKHIPDVVKWKIKSNFKKLNSEINPSGHLTGGGIIGIHLVWIPTWLSLRALPKSEKIEIRKLFNELKEWLYENYTKDDDFWIHNPYGWKRYEAILDWMDEEDHSQLMIDFKEYIEKMDNIRKTSFIDTFPELKNLLDN